MFQVRRVKDTDGSTRIAAILIAGLLAALIVSGMPIVKHITSTSATPSTQVLTGGDIHSIKHVIVIMQENRSFDEMFGTVLGTALMTAVERWAARCGANLVSLDTNLRSPLSVPFYEDRMGYTRHAVIFRKAVGHA